MLRREHGATLEELRDFTGWQANSVRCFISTTAKNLGCTISSVKDNQGKRRYRIERSD